MQALNMTLFPTSINFLYRNMLIKWPVTFGKNYTGDWWTDGSTVLQLAIFCAIYTTRTDLAEPTWWKTVSPATVSTVFNGHYTLSAQHSKNLMIITEANAEFHTIWGNKSSKRQLKILTTELHIKCFQALNSGFNKVQ